MAVSAQGTGNYENISDLPSFPRASQPRRACKSQNWAEEIEGGLKSKWRYVENDTEHKRDNVSLFYPDCKDFL